MTGLLALNVVILIYFAVLNILYLVLIIVAFRRMRTYVRRLRPVHIDDLVSASEGLSMSLLVPAYNEAEMIIDSVRSLLTLRYPDYEIIIINDGSTDATLVRLISAFELRRIERVATSSVATQPVGQVYQSRRHPNLYVVDKENGGKADALNAGLNYSRGAIISALDADTLLEPDALARLVRPFLEDSTTVAVGGIIRIVNGCRARGALLPAISTVQRPSPRSGSGLDRELRISTAHHVLATSRARFGHARGHIVGGDGAHRLQQRSVSRTGARLLRWSSPQPRRRKMFSRGGRRIDVVARPEVDIPGCREERGRTARGALSAH